MWLPWNVAAGTAVVLGVASLAVRSTSNAGRETKATLRELCVALFLYAIWMLSGELTPSSIDQAQSRGLSIWHAERWLHLPDERTLQQWTLHVRWLVEFANTYYIVAHVLPVGIFLVWLWLRHREEYPTWRNLLFFVSVACVLVQSISVAPPRMFPELGFIDTAAVYGPRVYSVGEPGQLAAMPSLHVGWAVLIAVAVVTASSSRWRWLVVAHPVLTVFAVTVTAYHWLLDGIVAVGILLVGMGGAALLARARRRAATRSDDGSPPPPEPPADPPGFEDEVGQLAG